jgi:23S rRNA pseudouridine2604 synthase
MDTENNSNEPVFPMRINKYLAMEGRGSRREMDRLVEEGKVIINGRVAVLGDKVNEGDKVEIKFRGVKEKKEGNEFAMKRRNQRRKGRR